MGDKEEPVKAVEDVKAVENVKAVEDVKAVTSNWWNKLPKQVRSVALVSAGVLVGIGLGRATGAFTNKGPAIKSAPTSIPITSRLLNFNEGQKLAYDAAEEIAVTAAAAVTAATSAEKTAKDKWDVAEKDLEAATTAAEAAKTAAAKATKAAAKATTAAAKAKRAVAAKKAAKDAADRAVDALASANSLKIELDKAVLAVTNAQNQLAVANANKAAALKEWTGSSWWGSD